MFEDQENTKEDRDCLVAWKIERMVRKGHSPAFAHSFIQSCHHETAVIVMNTLSTILIVVWQIAPQHVKRLHLIGHLVCKRKMFLGKKRTG